MAKFSVRDRVRHTKHPELEGKIVAFEYSQPGVLSLLPYKVYWDDDTRACRLLGNFWLYPPEDYLEAIPAPGDHKGRKGDHGQ